MSVTTSTGIYHSTWCEPASEEEMLVNPTLTEFLLFITFVPIRVYYVSSSSYDSFFSWNAIDQVFFAGLVNFKIQLASTLAHV